MSAPTRIAFKDLKLRVRDRSAIILGIIAPLALAFIFDLIFGAAFDPTSGLDLRYGVVDLDRSQQSDQFVSILEDIERDGLMTLARYEDRSSAEEAVEDGEIYAILSCPRDSREPSSPIPRPRSRWWATRTPLLRPRSRGRSPGSTPRVSLRLSWR